jgi:glycosyltransferase involved in cell wall biosynthesis
VKVLVLTQWYPPEPVVLLQELAQTLQGFGHQVTVLTGFPNYPSGRIYSGYRQTLWRRETLAGVPVARVPLYPEHGRSGVKRAINYLSFALDSAALGPLLVPRPDVVFVYHPPLTVGLPAYWLSRLWRVPFVYQIQDMWPETLSATGMLSSKRTLAWIGRFAQWVYSKAAAVCVISPGFRDNLIAKGVEPDRINVISNWIDTASYSPVPPDAALARETNLDGRFNVMFAGNMGEAQGLQTVVEAAQLLGDLPQVQFALVGDGISLPRLQDSVRQRNLTNVRFLGRYAESEMPALYALADVLLVHLKNAPLFRITVPHKVFAYMASGKPILAAVAGDSAEIVSSVGAGVTCAPEDPQALATAVRGLYRTQHSELDRMAQNGLRAARNEYAREYLVRQIEAVLLSVVPRHQPAWTQPGS